MRISDWSSDVCSSDLLAAQLRTAYHPAFDGIRPAQQTRRARQIASSQVLADPAGGNALAVQCHRLNAACTETGLRTQGLQQSQIALAAVAETKPRPDRKSVV